MAATFHDRVAARLRALTDFEVRHWLRNGIGPQDLPAEEIADELTRKPPSIGEFLDAALKDRARLRAAVPLVRRFVSALSLPPRRHTPPRLPIGGYADVTTRGDPERLLPSQFALDPDEFVRRFAEHELLFFRREDPHERKREHLALVVDQGVLTWGPVRLALGAAVLAFGRLAARRGLSFSVRCGSAPAERFAPPAADPDRFGQVLEASDLSNHPGHALAEEVLDPGAADRDIVLLTHPRVLREAEIRRLAGVLAGGCRLFALTATEDGHIELARVGAAGAVPVHRFRVDFAAPLPAEAKQSRVAVPTYTPWSGDVESIPYPFQFGLAERLRGLAFDAGGGRLLAMTHLGYLHVWNLADGTVEVVPRAASGREVLILPTIALGVENGFVVSGLLGSARVVAHYDWPTRSVTLHTLYLDADQKAGACFAFPHLHSVVVQVRDEYRGIDLSTGGRHPETFPARGDSPRARAAVQEARRLQLAPPHIPVVRTSWKEPPVPAVVDDPKTGQVCVYLPHTNVTFVPTSDGRPRLKTTRLRSALLAGNTLALAAGGMPTDWSIHDLAEDGKTLAEYPGNSQWEPVATLSSDGRLFARVTAAETVTVTAPADGRTILTTASGSSRPVDVWLGYRCLGLGHSGGGLFLDWMAGQLRVRDDVSPTDSFGKRATNPLSRPGGRFDPKSGRFIGMSQFSRWEVGLDIFGQIVFLREGVVACVLIHHNGQLAAWAPDGTRFGPPDLTGGPETPRAMVRVGEILREATR
jgi:hypothetical protein